MTQQEMYANKFHKNLKRLHPNIECLSKYVDRNTDLKFRCLICRHTFKNSPRNVTGNGRKTGCLKCGEENRIKQIQKSADLKLEKQEYKIKEFLKGTNTVWIERIDSNSILLMCKKCASKWIGHRSMILKYKKGGCKSCSSKEAAKDSYIKNILPKINQRKESEKFSIKPGRMLEGKCSICKSKWIVSMSTATHSTGCPACGKRATLAGSKRKRKTVKVRGKTFTCTGYEHHVIRHLIANGIKAKDISTKTKFFYFRYNGETKKHIPDIMIGNTVIEVKSPYTMGLNGKVFGVNALSMLKAKAKHVEKAGHEYLVYVVVESFKKGPVVVKLPNNWHTFSNEIIRRKVLDHFDNIIKS